MAVKLVELWDTIIIKLIAPVDAVVVLWKKLKVVDSERNIEEMVKVLKYMPLAIVQAAAYIQQKGSRYIVR